MSFGLLKIYLSALASEWTFMSAGIFGLCLIISQLIGASWYSPILFGNQFLSLAYPGISKADLNKKFSDPDMNKIYGFGMITGATTIFLLRGLIVAFDLKSGPDGAFVGFLPALIDGIFGLIHPCFEERPIKLYMLHQCYHMFTFSAVGAILALSR